MQGAPNTPPAPHRRLVQLTRSDIIGLIVSFGIIVGYMNVVWKSRAT
jgi:hypothetical protein